MGLSSVYDLLGHSLTVSFQAVVKGDENNPWESFPHIEVSFDGVDMAVNQLFTEEDLRRDLLILYANGYGSGTDSYEILYTLVDEISMKNQKLAREHIQSLQRQPV